MLLQDYSIVCQQCQVGADHLLYLSLHLKFWLHFWYIFFAKQNWSPLKCIFNAKHLGHIFYLFSLPKTLIINMVLSTSMMMSTRITRGLCHERSFQPRSSASIIRMFGRGAEDLLVNIEEEKTHGVPNRGRIKFSMIRMFGRAAFTSWIFLVKISSTCQHDQDVWSRCRRFAGKYFKHIKWQKKFEIRMLGQLGLCWQSFQTQRTPKENRV